MTEPNSNSAIAQVFLRHEKALKFFLSRYFKRAQDIEDISHEAFLRAFKAEKTTEIKHPKAFLFRVAKNVALNELTKKSNLLTDYIEENSGFDVCISEDNIERGFEARQQFHVFCESLASLPPQCQRVFVMRKVYGFSHKEISKTLGISTSTVEKHIAAGLKRSMEFMANANEVSTNESISRDQNVKKVSREP